MNKKLIGLVIAVAIIIVGGLIVWQSNRTEQAPAPDKLEVKVTKGESAEHLNNEKFPNNVTATQLKDEIADKGEVAVLFYLKDCPYCNNAAPNLLEAATSMNVDLLYLELNEYNNMAVEYSITEVPTLMVFSDGAVKKLPEGTAISNPLIGVKSTEEYKSFFGMYLGG